MGVLQKWIREDRKISIDLSTQMNSFNNILAEIAEKNEENMAEEEFKQRTFPKFFKSFKGRRN